MIFDKEAGVKPPSEDDEVATLLEETEFDDLESEENEELDDSTEDWLLLDEDEESDEDEELKELLDAGSKSYTALPETSADNGKDVHRPASTRTPTASVAG